MSMPRYPSYGKRGQHHSQRGHPVPSHGHHGPLQRTGSLPAQPPAPAPAPLAEAAAQPSPAQAATSNEFTPQSRTNYEQVVRFVNERWDSVKQDLMNPPDDPARRVMYYVEKEPNPKLKDFVPFDLEAFCERQRIKREKMQQQQQQQQQQQAPPPQ